MRDPNSWGGQEGMGADEGRRPLHGTTLKHKAQLSQEQD